MYAVWCDFRYRPCRVFAWVQLHCFFFFYVFFATVFAWPGECPDNRQVHLVCVVLELNATTVANNTLSFFLSLSLFDSLCLSCFPRLKVRWHLSSALNLIKCGVCTLCSSLGRGTERERERGRVGCLSVLAALNRMASKCNYLQACRRPTKRAQCQSKLHLSTCWFISCHCSQRPSPTATATPPPPAGNTCWGFPLIVSGIWMPGCDLMPSCPGTFLNTSLSLALQKA